MKKNSSFGRDWLSRASRLNLTGHFSFRDLSNDTEQFARKRSGFTLSVRDYHKTQLLVDHDIEQSLELCSPRLQRLKRLTGELDWAYPFHAHGTVDAGQQRLDFRMAYEF